MTHDLFGEACHHIVVQTLNHKSEILHLQTTKYCSLNNNDHKSKLEFPLASRAMVEERNFCFANCEDTSLTAHAWDVVHLTHVQQNILIVNVK